MKKFFSLVISAAALFAFTALPLNAPAQGQYTANGMYSVNLTNAFSTAAITWGAYPSTTNNISKALGPFRQKSVTVQFDAADDAATSTSFIMYYALSTDGVSWTANQPAGFTVAALGASTNYVTATTNISLYGNGYFKIAYLTNASASVNCTNGWLRVPINYNSP